MEHWSAAGGMVMVTNPQTGEILAMAQVPRMDPNMPGHYPKEARHIRILTDAVEPGSAFKAFVVAPPWMPRWSNPGTNTIARTAAGRWAPRK